MPTYRVYISRNTTPSPIWDWAESVYANNPKDALSQSYNKWLSTNPKPTPPALDKCRSMVNAPKAMLTSLSDSTISPGQQAIIANIESQVKTMLSTKLDGTYSTVNYPAGFNYGITYGNNAYFNRATLQDIDTLLAFDSNGLPDLTGQEFSALYAQVMQSVTFSFSQNDQATMNKQDTAASGQVASIITEFANAGGTFSNPLPFGGKLQDAVNQLTKSYGSLDLIPDTLGALRNAVATWKSLAGDSYALHNRYYAATARIAAALANTVKPSASNGGQQVDDSNYYVGYTPNKLPSANALIGSLSTTSNKVEVSIELSSFSSNSSQLKISGETSFDIPIADILGISLNASASYDLSRYTSSSTNIQMNMTYPGVTLFPSIPSTLSTDNTSGWYANDILQEVAAKTGQDATGYKLQGEEFNVSDLFGPGKAFSRLKTFVISQQPTIALTFTGADASKITSDFQANASLKIDLFGMFTLGSASGSYSVQSVDSSSSSGTVTVTFGPPQVSGTIPIQQQIAYVMGGVASYPPNNI